MTTRPLMIMGTRPEAIKMAPVVAACHASSGLAPIVCFTGQHREMLGQVAEYFGLRPHVDLALMSPDQTLSGLSARCLERIDETIVRWQPDCVVAQGDTTTVMAAAIAAFHRRVPFVHIEAGLRTGNLDAPWPEEFNRRAASIVTSLHCAPTQTAADNLRREGVPEERIHVTGNTVIDALLQTLAQERANSSRWLEKHPYARDRRLVLVTGHRRENHGANLQAICAAIAELAARLPDTVFVYPVHLNPRVSGPVRELLGNIANVALTEPAIYPEFVWLMDRAHLIVTDSGGVQEEAPSLGKPVLVTRETTERPEAVSCGAAVLLGACRERLVSEVLRLCHDPDEYARRQVQANPYGDGRAAGRIASLLHRFCRRATAA